MPIIAAHFNGQPATADDLAPLAFAAYAHFTAMQVRDRAVRGLDLHLARLRTASDELFGRHLPDDRVRELLASAVAAGPPDVSLTCYVSPRGADTLDVLVGIADPATPPAGPLALDVVPHERYLPHLKHVGEVAKSHLFRRAVARGFDDAVFTDAAGRLSEATIWNVAFWDGRSVLWPEAAVLPGVTMQILRRRLAARDVGQRTLPILASDVRFPGAVLNSWSPGIAIARVGDRDLPDGRELTSLLRAAYDSEPPVAL